MTNDFKAIEALAKAADLVKRLLIDNIDRETMGGQISRYKVERKEAADLILSLTSQLAEAREAKDAAYLERNQVVAALSKLFPSTRGRTAIEGWSDDWHGCVYIKLPTGQVSWHYHDSHEHLFSHVLFEGETIWDGHSTKEKYERLAALKALAKAAIEARHNK